MDYDFTQTWDVSRATFEMFTVGTLVVIAAMALLGYAWTGSFSRAPDSAQRFLTPALDPCCPTYELEMRKSLLL
ncbi:hypothetical protein BST13_02510 [Mycobacterium aquaticum]|uniref:Uncharacterized protein n=1 Tax=Mycobacterium aquaticum TaxID=1927124 RepID=A0A1X0BA27_9MYCO|nr:hypothetical protein BST13_02510 [Mycobacterium aquaticum]